MSYSLRSDESIPIGLKRIAREQLERSSAMLRDGAIDDATAVHGARTALKKTRAILRLIVDEIGVDAARRENAHFRDIARALSATRDDAVVAHAFERFCAPRLHGSDADRLRSHLARHTPDDDGERRTAMRIDVAARIDASLEHVQRWPIDRPDFRAVQGGLRRGYRAVRSAYAAVLAEPGDEALHEWRKNVKLVWYHERILQPRGNGTIRRTIAELDELGELLGLDRDLALVAERLAPVEGDAGPEASVASALAVIDETRAAFRQRAKALGARLFQQRARDYVERLRTAWESRAGDVEIRDAATSSAPSLRGTNRQPIDGARGDLRRQRTGTPDC